MTSTLRSFAQIPSRVKYFVYGTGIDVSSGGVPNVSVFTMSAGDYATVGSAISTAAFTALDNAGSIDVNASASVSDGALLKDMGRQITFYNESISSYPHVAIYREVQLVNGSGSEGVGGSSPAWNSNYFVKVWSADGDGVNVTRTG